MSSDQLPLVSVIICFYNEEDCLARCLNSVLSQTHKNLEVILVNDGSTDGSLSIAGDYAERNKNFKIISVSNSGLGAARNAGLKMTEGEYLTFLDADDEMEPGMIEKCVSAISQSRSDMAICGFTVYNQDNTALAGGWPGDISGSVSAGEVINDVYHFKVSCTVWAKLYKTNIAECILFPEGVWFEDRPYLLEYLLRIVTISFVKQSLLRIHGRGISITRRTIEVKRIEDTFKIFERELAVLEKHSKSGDLESAVAAYHIHSMFDNFILLMIDEKKIGEKEEVRASFLLHCDKTNKLIGERQIKTGWKGQLNMGLLVSPRFLGWKMARLILYLFRRRRIEAVLKLKS